MPRYHGISQIGRKLKANLNIARRHRQWSALESDGPCRCHSDWSLQARCSQPL